MDHGATPPHPTLSPRGGEGRVRGQPEGGTTMVHAASGHTGRRLSLLLVGLLMGALLVAPAVSDTTKGKPEPGKGDKADKADKGKDKEDKDKDKDKPNVPPPPWPKPIKLTIVSKDKDVADTVKF